MEQKNNKIFFRPTHKFTYIILIFTLIFTTGCSEKQSDNLDDIFVSNSGLSYSTIINLDKNKFDEEINYDLNLKFEDLKLYIEDSKHYVDRNLMFSLFYPQEYTIKVYDNQIIAKSENMNIIIRLTNKESYKNHTSFFNDLIKFKNVNLTQNLTYIDSKFGKYNTTQTKFKKDNSTYQEYLIEKENYFFNIEFEIKSNEIRENYIIDYFYNTILLPIN